MGAAQLTIPNGLSLVTLADRALPEWWVAPPGSTHIACAARTRAERNLLAARLDEAVMRADRAVLLVAQGAGCFAAAWWARLSPASYVSRVAGALLFEPGDARDPHVDALLDTFASPRTALPFPSIVLDDHAGPGAMPQHLRGLAESWGSMIGDRDTGPDTAFARTRRALERLTASVVEREVRTAHALLGEKAR